MDWTKMNNLPSRGEIWLANLNPVRGREQAGFRPCLVISVDQFNHGPAELVIVVPITSKNKSIPLHIEISGKETGLDLKSYIKSEDIRSISRDRLEKRIGRVSEEVMCQVLELIKILLDIT
ncbi:MAG TPA: type II toxin-antitoxin system PemK/MazF family toxin [Mesotoga sp.]|jgi:mRNA interferase MazF|nr:type II toxin-antitoxin system PemK/MazF family toxin [Mesotoga infera]HRR39028.1 type II toxin-antitoxin system PemK/MazF family toxin [Rectinema sp.]HRT39636.1 type II toxin-antitoxin system PemK/MazF family toxin [Rectinema sp.]HRV03362.1 type II toxin-antitoxin system PemK/MazF family toxin [Mesotoga sp.]